MPFTSMMLRLITLLALLWCGTTTAHAAYRASSDSFNNGATATGTKPTGTADADWLLAWVVADGTSRISSVPSGWAQVVDASDSGPDGQTAILYSKIASGEPASWDWGLTGGCDWIVIVGAWSGRNTGGSLVSQGTTNTSSNATPISMALTGITAASGDDLAWFGQLDKQGGTDVWSWTASPASHTERQDQDVTWVASTLHTQDNVSAGATGTMTGTATRSSGASNAGWSGVVVAIPLSGGGGGGSVVPKLMLLGVGP